MNRTVRTTVFYFAFLLVFSSFGMAQITKESVEQIGAICGNKIREPAEACDKTSNASDNDFCPTIGKILNIPAMVCYDKECSCLPRRYIRCGDGHTTGNEACEEGDVDYCPRISETLGTRLECDKTQCLCKAIKNIEEKEADTVNLTQSLCGNHNVDTGEECDPSGRLCTKDTIQGVCSENCTCTLLDDQPTILPTQEPQPTQSPQKEPEPTLEPVIDSGISDTTYTVILVFVVLFFLASLGIGSYLLFKRSQQTEEQLPEVEKDKNNT